MGCRAKGRDATHVTHLSGGLAHRYAAPIAPAGIHHPQIVGADEDDDHLGLQGPQLAVHHPPQQVGGLVACTPPSRALCKQTVSMACVMYVR
jgi:hypothetical protein